MPTEETIQFSIVIPCYNEARYIADTLRSLQAQTYKGKYEIIVVDNNCTDNTATIAKSFGVEVVSEKNPGVCWARQKGTEVARGEIAISVDADTLYEPTWLQKIANNFAKHPNAIGVAGPCRYKDGPIWGKIYPHLLFGLVYVFYLLTGRIFYATATNIAFKKALWPGYNTMMTQGGDELDLIRNLQKRGKMIFDNTNPTHSSGRRLTRGLLYNFIFTFLIYYFLAYHLNRIFKRRVLGSAPAYRTSENTVMQYIQTVGLDAFLFFLLLLPFAPVRHYIFHSLNHVSHRTTQEIRRRIH